MKAKRAIPAQVQPIVISNFIPLEINSNDQELIDNFKKFNKFLIDFFSIPNELIQSNVRTATEILFKMKYRI